MDLVDWDRDGVSPFTPLALRDDDDTTEGEAAERLWCVAMAARATESGGSREYEVPSNLKRW